MTETFEFSHEAMHTELTLRLLSDDFRYAKSAACDAFDLVDSLENLLSMYKEGSDISIVNALKVGEMAVLTEMAADCLMKAFKACEMSKGAIDVCMGDVFLSAKKDQNLTPHNPPGRGFFEFDPENLLIKKNSPGRIDLGAIGKGFAVDSIAELLSDVWEIPNAFINFGASSIRAMGGETEEGWKINFGEEKFGGMFLKNESCGASGTDVLGEHIIDARTGNPPENPKFRAWAFCESAAMADAMSTAFMILPKDDIESICKEYGLKAAFQISKDSPVEKIGFQS